MGLENKNINPSKQGSRVLKEFQCWRLRLVQGSFAADLQG